MARTHGRNSTYCNGGCRCDLCSEAHFRKSREERGQDPDAPRRSRRSGSLPIAEHRAITDAAKDVPCMDCGGKFPPVAMDFDHVRGTKVRGIGRGRFTREALLAEMAKCDIVCAVCHRLRTQRRWALPSPT